MEFLKQYFNIDTQLEMRKNAAKKAQQWLNNISMDAESDKEMPDKIKLPEFIQIAISEMVERTKRWAGIRREFYFFIREVKGDSDIAKVDASDIKGLSAFNTGFVGVHKEAYDESTFGIVHSHPFECPPSVPDIAGLVSAMSEGLMMVVTVEGTIYIVSANANTKFEELVNVDTSKLKVPPVLQGLVDRIFQLPKDTHNFLSLLTLWAIPQGIELSILNGLRFLKIEKPDWRDSLMARMTLVSLSFCENYDLSFYKGSVNDFILRKLV